MDKYELGQSKMGCISEDGEEIRLDLQLEKNHYHNYALIYGYISNCKRQPLNNACVIFSNKNNVEIDSVYTSQEGFYSYMGVKLNTITRIRIIKEGYRTKISNYIFTCSKIINYNAVLKKCVCVNNSLISGHVLDEKNKPLKNVSLYLIKKTNCDKNNIYKYTNSNTYGQFVFTGIPNGKYIILINDSIFNVYSKNIDIFRPGNIISIDIKLTKKLTKTKFGTIKRSDGKPITNALVTLFKIDCKNKLIPTKYTITNEKGEYCFNDIPYGNYVVKVSCKNTPYS